MKTFQDRIKEVTTKGWIACGVWCTIYVAFIIWVAWGDWASLGWLVLLPIIADILPPSTFHGPGGKNTNL